MTLKKLTSCLVAVTLTVFISGCNKAADEGSGDTAPSDSAPTSDLGESGDASDMASDAGTSDDSDAATDDTTPAGDAATDDAPVNDSESGSTNP